MKYDVFISYSRKDQNTINLFCKRFDDLGIKYWIDKTGISGGNNFRTVIIDAIEDSKCVVYFSSKKANESRWTAKEIIYAIDNNKTIIPVKLDNSAFNKDVQFELGRIDTIDYSDASEEAKEKVVRSICEELGIEYKEPENPPPPRKTLRRRNAIYAAIALCLTAIIGILAYRCNNSSDNDFEYVDLGLESGTLWANMNLGAHKITDYGNLYRWGETAPELDYSKYTYPRKPFSSIVATKYDAAFVTDKESHLPTIAQYKELIEGCTWQSVSIEGILCLKGTSKKNKKNIYFPATGYSKGKEREYEGKYGYYWTGEKENGNAQAFIFDEMRVEKATMYYGRAIRAVKPPKK